MENIFITKNEDLRTSLVVREDESSLYTLPVDILSLIYMYDNTYHIKFKEVIIQIKIRAQRLDAEKIYKEYMIAVMNMHNDYDSYSDNYDVDNWSDDSDSVSVYSDSGDEIDFRRTYISFEKKQEQFRLEVEMLKFEKEKFEELLSENNNTIDHRYRNYKNSNKKFTKIQKYEVGIKANNKKNKSKTTW